METGYGCGLVQGVGHVGWSLLAAIAWFSVWDMGWIVVTAIAWFRVWDMWGGLWLLQ